MNNIQETLRIVEIIQIEIIKIYKMNPNSGIFNQMGLIDGMDIVRDYIDHNEMGCAVDHVFYMIYESGINVNENYLDRINIIANDIGVKNKYLGINSAQQGDAPETGSSE